MKAFAKTLFIIVLTSLLFTAGAKAAGEVASADLSLTPQTGSFYTNAFAPANWRMETSMTSAESQILPTKRISLSMPTASQMKFVIPSGMPVCPDNKIGPTTSNSAPASIIQARCPNSILGNGDATFLLNQNNNPASQLFGVVLVFNGGLVDGNPRLKFWAYSYDTGVAIYTEGVLQNGQLDIPIPQLTADSSVNSLNVSIPGKAESIYLPTQDITVNLPAGQARKYVQVKCSSSPLPFESTFTLGKRLSDGSPIGEETTRFVTNPIPCSGVVAKASLASPSVKGSSRAKANRAATYSITVRNRGAADAKGVVVNVKGAGVSKRVSVGTVPGSGSKTVQTKLTFKKRGKIKVAFTASGSGVNRATSYKTVTVS